MAKSLFPDSMMRTSELSIETIAGKLTYFQLQAHLLHWQTFGGFEHLAVGDLYDLLFNIKDPIIEKIMGYQGKRIKVFNIDPLKDYSTGFSTTLTTEIIIFAKQLQDYANKNNMPDIENMSQDLSGKVAQIKYRLTLS